MNQKRSSDDGFAMVEALAAVAFSAITAAALLATLTAASHRANESRLRELALREAEALVEEASAGASPAVLPIHGELLGGSLTWSRQITPAAQAGLEAIAVDVAWVAGTKRGVTHLEAYRFPKI